MSKHQIQEVGDGEMLASASTTQFEADNLELPLIHRSKDAIIFMHKMNKHEFRKMATALLKEMDKEEECLNKDGHVSNNPSPSPSNSGDDYNLVNKKGDSCLPAEMSEKTSIGEKTSGLYDFRKIHAILQEVGTDVQNSGEDKLEELYPETVASVLQVETENECSREQDVSRVSLESSAASYQQGFDDECKDETGLSAETQKEDFLEEIATRTDVDNSEEIHVGFKEEGESLNSEDQLMVTVGQDCSRPRDSNIEETAVGEVDPTLITSFENGVSSADAQIPHLAPRNLTAEGEPLKYASEVADECRKQDGLINDALKEALNKSREKDCDLNKSMESTGLQEIAEKSPKDSDRRASMPALASVIPSGCSAPPSEFERKHIKQSSLSMSSNIDFETADYGKSNEIAETRQISFVKARSFWLNSDALNKSMESTGFNEIFEKSPKDSDRSSMSEVAECGNSTTKLEKHMKSDTLELEDLRESTDESFSVETEEKLAEGFCVTEDGSLLNTSEIRKQTEKNENKTACSVKFSFENVTNNGKMENIEEVAYTSKSTVNELSPKDSSPRCKECVNTNKESCPSQEIGKLESEESCLSNTARKNTDQSSEINNFRTGPTDMENSPLEETVKETDSNLFEEKLSENGVNGQHEVIEKGNSSKVDSTVEDYEKGATSSEAEEDIITKSPIVENDSLHVATLKSEEGEESGFLEITVEEDCIPEKILNNDKIVSPEKDLAGTVESESVEEISKLEERIVIEYSSAEDTENEPPVEPDNGLTEMHSEGEISESSSVAEMTSEDGIGESDDGKSVEGYLENENCETETTKRITRKQAKAEAKADEVDAAPTRIRRRKVAPALAKEVIPEHGTPSRDEKSSSSTRGSFPSEGARRLSSLTLRTTRSKSLDPSPQKSNEDTKSRYLSTESSISATQRTRRAKTPDVKLKSDIKVPVRSSPRKITRMTSSNTTESSATTSRGKTSTRTTRPMPEPSNAKRVKRGA